MARLYTSKSGVPLQTFLSRYPPEAQAQWWHITSTLCNAGSMQGSHEIYLTERDARARIDRMVAEHQDVWGYCPEPADPFADDVPMPQDYRVEQDGDNWRFYRGLGMGHTLVKLYSPQQWEEREERKPGPEKQFPFHLHLRFDADARSQLHAIKEQTGESFSEIVRRLIRENAPTPSLNSR